MNKQSTLFDDYVNLKTGERFTKVGLYGQKPETFLRVICEECEIDTKYQKYIDSAFLFFAYSLSSGMDSFSACADIFFYKDKSYMNYNGMGLPNRVQVGGWLYNTDSVTTINKNISNVFDKVFDRIDIWSKIPGNKFNFDLYTYELKAISDYQIELIITEKPTNNYINDLTADDCMDTVKFFKGGSDENN